MKYINIDGKNVVGYDLTTRQAYLYSAEEADAQKKEAELKLAGIPPEPDDSALLEWAKLNYPMMDYSVQKATLEKEISDTTSIISATSTEPIVKEEPIEEPIGEVKP